MAAHTYLMKHTILDIYESQLVHPDRLLYPTSDNELEAMRKKLHELGENGYFIGLIDGAYDVPTENHVWSLRDCRRRMAEIYFGDEFINADVARKRELIASDKLVLIVTVDADERVSDKKSYRSDKGNILRPVYNWSQRANRIAGLTVPDEKGGFRPVADIITVDGDRAHHDTFLESHLTLGKYMSENNIFGVWLLYEWHDWYEPAIKITDKYVIMDVLVKEKISSTTIINKIRSGK